MAMTLHNGRDGSHEEDLAYEYLCRLEEAKK